MAPGGINPIYLEEYSIIEVIVFLPKKKWVFCNLTHHLKIRFLNGYIRIVFPAKRFILACFLEYSEIGGEKGRFRNFGLILENLRFQYAVKDAFGCSKIISLNL